MKVILVSYFGSFEKDEYILFSPKSFVGLGIWGHVPEVVVGVLNEMVNREGEPVEIVMDACSKRSGKYIEVSKEDMELWKKTFDVIHRNQKQKHSLKGVKK